MSTEPTLGSRDGYNAGQRAGGDRRRHAVCGDAYGVLDIKVRGCNRPTFLENTELRDTVVDDDSDRLDNVQGDFVAKPPKD